MFADDEAGDCIGENATPQFIAREKAMSGSAELSTALQQEGIDPATRDRHLEGLSQFHTQLAQLHDAEAQLSRTRADLASRGVALWVADDLHW